MAYINRHSKDYFTWSASQSATYWMRNEEERELDRRWKTAWYSCETRFRDACLESNSRARYTCKLKSCIYIYIYVYSKRNWRKKKEKKKNKPEQNLQNHLNGIDSSNHVTRVFLAYKKKKKSTSDWFHYWRDCNVTRIAESTYLRRTNAANFEYINIRVNWNVSGGEKGILERKRLWTVSDSFRFTGWKRSRKWIDWKCFYRKLLMFQLRCVNNYRYKISLLSRVYNYREK